MPDYCPPFFVITNIQYFCEIQCVWTIAIPPQISNNASTETMYTSSLRYRELNPTPQGRHLRQPCVFLRLFAHFPDNHRDARF